MKYLLGIVLLVSLIILPFYFFVLPKITIEKISCSSQFGPCNENLANKLKSFENSNILKVYKDINTFLKENAQVISHSIQYKFATELVVYIVENTPKFAISKEDDKRFALINSDGEVVGIEEESNLPTLLTSGNLPEKGEYISKDTLFALNLMYDVYSSYQVEKGLLDEDSLTIELNNGPNIIFPLEGDKEVLLGSLSLIMSRLNSYDKESRIEASDEIEVVDLRFNNPIIK